MAVWRVATNESALEIPKQTLTPQSSYSFHVSAVVGNASATATVNFTTFTTKFNERLSVVIAGDPTLQAASGGTVRVCASAVLTTGAGDNTADDTQFAWFIRCTSCAASSPAAVMAPVPAAALPVGA